jgi:hypothetical protein
MSLRLNGSTSGYVEIDAPATAGNNTLTLPDGNGTSGQYLQTDGSGELSWQTVASLSNAQDGAGTDFEFNSGYGSNATAYGCRAWVNFNGTGTVAIRGSGNVSSITDNGTGDYTVNFATALPDANYSIVGGSGENAFVGCVQANKTASSVNVFTRTYANDLIDYDNVNVAIFR